MKYVLYNPKANRGAFKNNLQEFCNKENISTKINITEIEDMTSFLSSLKQEDEVILFGGDGTLNKFVNSINGYELNNKVLLYPCGTGNDFFRDVKATDDQQYVEVNSYIKKLPVVIVNGKESFFINGVGYGIDGYCCEEGDRLASLSDKPINYTSIAIKGLLFKYKAPNATVNVDGVEKKYKRVTLAPTMKGRFYGGGMMVAPKQNRLDEDNSVSVVVMHKSHKLKTLMIFPSIFKGEHVKYTKYIDVLKGHQIEVTFDRPTALQIDGETIKNVTKYVVKA